MLHYKIPGWISHTQQRVMWWFEKRDRRIASSSNTYMIDKLNSKDLDHRRQEHTQSLVPISVFLFFFFLFYAIISKQFSSRSREDCQYILIIWAAQFDRLVHYNNGSLLNEKKEQWLSMLEIKNKVGQQVKKTHACTHKTLNNPWIHFSMIKPTWMF